MRRGLEGQVVLAGLIEECRTAGSRVSFRQCQDASILPNLYLATVTKAYDRGCGPCRT